MEINPYKPKWTAKLILGLLLLLSLVTLVLLLPGIIVLFFFYLGHKAVLQHVDKKMARVFYDEIPMHSLDPLPSTDPGNIEEVVSFACAAVPTLLSANRFATVIRYAYYQDNLNNLVFDLLCRTSPFSLAYKKVTLGCDLTLSYALWDRMRHQWMGKQYDGEMPELPSICIGYWDPNTCRLPYIKFEDDNNTAAIYYSP